MDIFFDNEFKTLIPPLQTEEYEQLEASMIAEGNRDPIVIWKETKLLLDGHNRYNICVKNSITLKPATELSFLDRNAAMVWIIQNQFGRRNINAYQRSVLALKMEEIISRRAKENLVTPTGGRNKATLQNSAKSIDTRQELAKLAHVSHDTIAKVKTIEAKATPEQKAKLATGKATVNQVYVQLRREEVREQVKKAEWPEGKYRVIYSDPPWQYDNTIHLDNGTQPEDYYPTLTVPAICQLPVVDLALDDAVLFLWTTSPMLEDAFKVINAWGFKYKTSFVWDKVKHNMGHYNSVRHEFLLIAVRGSCQPDERKLYDSVQSVERTEHSEKPETFREIINTLYPYGPRIELFARKKSEGWEAYGNQLR